MNSINNQENYTQRNLLNHIEFDEILSGECSYIDLTDIPDHIETLNNFRICHLNIHSIPAKCDDFTEFLDKLKSKSLLPDIVLLCETFFNERNFNRYSFEGYVLISEYRKKSSGGGVSILVKSSIKFNVRDDLKIYDEKKFESIFIEIPQKNKPDIIVGEVYRIPGTNETQFLDYYESIVKRIRQEHKRIIIGTDQNLDYLKIDIHRNTMKFFELNLSNKLLPSIVKPTRVTNSTATLIDNIYIDADLYDGAKADIILSDISDHFPCMATFQEDILQNRNDISERRFRKFDDVVFRNIKAALRNVNWTDLEDLDVNSASNQLDREISKAIDFYAPEKWQKHRKSYKKKEPWFTSGLMVSSLKCLKMFKKVLHLPRDSEKYQEYRDYRKMYQSLRRKMKFNYFQEIISKHRNNSKKLWGILNKIRGKLSNKQNLSDEIIINGMKDSNERNISNAFAKFYSEIGKTMVEKIAQNGTTKDPISYIKTRVRNSCFLYPVSKKEIENLIKNLKPKDSRGPDGLSNNILKAIYPSILDALCILFNKSLYCGQFPDSMKVAIVKPLFKSKSKSEITNYRPISLLPIISKILEKVVHHRLTKFLDKNNVLYSGQYGFRKHRSTNDAILDLTGNVVDALDKGMFTIGVFLDMSKAFDSIEHDTLFKKIEHYGIRGTTLQWLKSYLSNRHLQVQYKNTLSGKFAVKYGTPQGSVLGPLIYSLLVNDMPKCMKFSNCVMFADDTTVYASGSNIKFLYKKINEDLKRLMEWFNSNSLALNVEKSCHILFRTKNRNPKFSGQIVMNGKEIKRVTYTKFLGAFIDELLNWNMHVNHLLLKLASGLYSLNMCKKLIPSNAKRLLYFANIQSHLSYAISAWGPMISASNLRKIRVQQNKAIRAIFNITKRSRVSAYYKKASILPIADLCELNLVKVSFRYINDLLPKRIENLFEIPTHQYQTRNRNALQVKHHTTHLYNKSYLGQSPHLWLNLSDNIRNNNKINLLNKAFTKYKMDSI